MKTMTLKIADVRLEDGYSVWEAEDDARWCFAEEGDAGATDFGFSTMEKAIAAARKHAAARGIELEVA